MGCQPCQPLPPELGGVESGVLVDAHPVISRECCRSRDAEEEHGEVGWNFVESESTCQDTTRESDTKDFASQSSTRASRRSMLEFADGNDGTLDEGDEDACGPMHSLPTASAAVESVSAPTSLTTSTSTLARARHNSVLYWQSRAQPARQSILTDYFADFFNPSAFSRQASAISAISAPCEASEPLPFVRRKINKKTRTELQLIGTMERMPSQRLQLIIENYGDINDTYSVSDKILGEGSFGAVLEASMKATGAMRATKRLCKAQMKQRFGVLKKEIEITKMTDHPNIVKLYEIFEDVTHIHLVMELCACGSLEARIKSSGPFAEVGPDNCQKLMAQLLKTVFYLHNCGICHRDLKPDNFLVACTRKKSTCIRVTDFGLSCTFRPGQVLTACVGTPCYMAPEILDRRYNQAADLWSCGVIMYQLLCGYRPFSADTDQALKKLVKTGRVKFPAADWVDVSSQAAELILQFLQVDPSVRLNTQNALKHAWIQVDMERIGDITLKASLVQELRIFRSLNKFKRAAYHVIASMLNEEQIAYPREVFMMLDKDGDGFVNVSELWIEMKRSYPQIFQEVMHIFQDGDWGVVDYGYTEFVAATFDRALCDRKLVWAAFNVFDHDGGGTISKDEIANGNVLGLLKGDDLATIVADFDQDGDGEIDFDEFREMLQI